VRYTCYTNGIDRHCVSQANNNNNIVITLLKWLQILSLRRAHNHREFVDNCRLCGSPFNTEQFIFYSHLKSFAKVVIMHNNIYITLRWFDSIKYTYMEHADTPQAEAKSNFSKGYFAVFKTNKTSIETQLFHRLLSIFFF